MKEHTLCPTDKEYKMLLFYDTFVPNYHLLAAGFDLMAHGLKNHSWQLIDLPNLKETIVQDFEYLLIRRRFESLKVWSKNSLTYDEDGFHLEGHMFESLDQIHKALENKAFL